MKKNINNSILTLINSIRMIKYFKLMYKKNPYWGKGRDQRPNNLGPLVVKILELYVPVITLNIVSPLSCSTCLI